LLNFRKRKEKSETCQPLTKEKLTVEFNNPLFVMHVIIILTLIVYELKFLTSVSEMRAYFK